MKDEHHPTPRDTRWGYITSTLEKTDWDIRKASVLLNVSERFLRNEIRKMGRGEVRGPERRGKKLSKRKTIWKIYSQATRLSMPYGWERCLLSNPLLAAFHYGRKPFKKSLK